VPDKRDNEAEGPSPGEGKRLFAKAYGVSAEQSPTASGLRLLSVYETGARAAIHEQPEAIMQTLALLRKTLDADKAPDLALSLVAIYNDIEQATQEERFVDAARMFEELKGLWQAYLRTIDLQK